jgi:MFS family permease
MVSLATKTLFKDYLKLDPSYTQVLGSFIGLPWTFKLLYGIVSDNFPLRGSKRKPYLIINGISLFVCLNVLSLFTESSPYFVAILLMMNSLNTAFNDVVVDAIMVVQSRKDPENGSEDLQTFSWVMLGIGGIFGSIFSAFMTEYMHPRYSYIAYSSVGLLTAYVASKLSPDAERDDFEKEAKKADTGGKTDGSDSSDEGEGQVHA